MTTAKITILMILLVGFIIAMVIAGISSIRDARKERAISIKTCDLCLKRHWECTCFTKPRKGK